MTRNRLISVACLFFGSVIFRFAMSFATGIFTISDKQIVNLNVFGMFVFLGLAYACASKQEVKK